MKIYHGSPKVVPDPELRKGKLHNDYGQGFYCTQDYDLACEWACQKADGHGFVNEYELDISHLTVLNLDDDPQGVIGWAATLMKYRPVNYTTGGLSGKDLARFTDRYASDFSRVDVIEGNRADDSYFNIMRMFASNSISVRQLDYALRLGDLGRQIVLKSPRAFEAIEFVGAQRVECAKWNPLREKRNRRAREIFLASVDGRGELDGFAYRSGTQPQQKGHAPEDDVYLIDLLRQL